MPDYSNEAIVHRASAVDRLAAYAFPAKRMRNAE